MREREERRGDEERRGESLRMPSFQNPILGQEDELVLTMEKGEIPPGIRRGRVLVCVGVRALLSADLTSQVACPRRLRSIHNVYFSNGRGNEVALCRGRCGIGWLGCDGIRIVSTLRRRAWL